MVAVAGEGTVQRVSPDMLMEAMDAVTDGVVIVDFECQEGKSIVPAHGRNRTGSGHTGYAHGP